MNSTPSAASPPSARRSNPRAFGSSDKLAKRIAHRLSIARSEFADAVSQVAEIAEQVALDPAHSDVQAHLEVLSRQASQLAGAPA